MLPKTVSSPEENEAWVALCQDPRWKYNEDISQPPNKELFYAKSWIYDNNFPEWGEEQTVVVAPKSPDDSGMSFDMHRLALAPKYVFETKNVINETKADGMDIYMKRLICILCRRFVIMPRPSLSEEEFEIWHEDSGVPNEGARYWWRYWDNEGNVWQVNRTKFTDSVGGKDDFFYSMATGQPHTYKTLEEATIIHGNPPGEFELGNDSNLDESTSKHYPNR